MGKSLYIAEKPSVAQEFAKALHLSTARRDGYLEGENAVVTWCVGHLVTMSYPEVYDESYRRWRLDTLPFLPDHFLYEVIESSKKQFDIVKGLLNRPDVDTIYVCTDSGREGEYIYRLVEQEAGVKGKERRRVWIDSQTEEEILRGIKEARPLSDYDNLAASAYLRAKEDYLMGINFSRLLTLKYGNVLAGLLKEKRCVISVGRVMTCVLGMVVRREREIRSFEKTPFYRVLADVKIPADGDAAVASDAAAGMPTALTGMTDVANPVAAGQETKTAVLSDLEWRAVEGSAYFESPKLYKENGFSKREDALALIGAQSRRGDLAAQGGLPDNVLTLIGEPEVWGSIARIEKKKEKKNAPLLYNLAELQNDCSRMFKISPDETLQTVQELYEKKLVTYPRTDARVLSTAVAKQIDKNIRGLGSIPGVAPFVREILEKGLYKGVAKTRYTNDKQITDHYAIIPTGSGLNELSRLSSRSVKVYEVIVRRFLAIFYPPAVYEKIGLTVKLDTESYFASDRILSEEGYLAVMQYSFRKKRAASSDAGVPQGSASPEGEDEGAEDGNPEEEGNAALAALLPVLKKGSPVQFISFAVREGETSPPKRYNSGSMILAMENAGQLIEDEELRAQIKGSGIGTSATRAEILKKLFKNGYLNLNSKTQIITPTLLGEMIFDVVYTSLTSMLNPELTASWEKGLTYVAEGTITEDEYMQKLENYIRRNTDRVMRLYNQQALNAQFAVVSPFYAGKSSTGGQKGGIGGSNRRRTTRKKEEQS